MAVKPAEYDAEEPVVEAIRQGDRYAFSELVRRQGQWVRGVVFGVLGDPDRTDDVTQQVWFQFWQRIGELRDIQRWRPWLYRLARNAALDEGRGTSRRKKQAQGLQAREPRTAVPDATDQSVNRSERHTEVLAAIQSLPALYREPFVLRHLNDWSYREIADVMDMPVDSVETRLVRARRLLRESLEENQD